MHYITVDGRKIIDAAAGCGVQCRPWPSEIDPGSPSRPRRWTTHRRSVCIPQAFELASRIADLRLRSRSRVLLQFGPEAADTALKIALAYHQINGPGGRARLIGRVRGYHGVGFGRTAVGASQQPQDLRLAACRVDHLPGPMTAGSRLHRRAADYGANSRQLENLVNLHGANHRRLIVEPWPESTGVLPAPKGLSEAAAESPSKHGILLIFDEVITGYGRLGFAYRGRALRACCGHAHFRKGVTNGAAPMGGVLGAATPPRRLHHRPEHVVD